MSDNLIQREGLGLIKPIFERLMHHNRTDKDISNSTRYEEW
jgi:hypothetical protein